MGRRQRRFLGALPVSAWSFLVEHHEEALPVAPAVASVAVKGPVAFSCSRYSHLDSGHYFFELVVLASACLGVLASTTVAFGRISAITCVSARAVCTWRVRLGRGSRHAPVNGCYWKNFLSLVHALFALGIWCIISVSLSLAVIVLGVWVLLMSTKIGFFGRRLSSWEQCLVLQWIPCSASVLWLWTYFTHFLRCGEKL